MYQISLAANGNEVTEYYDEPMCGDFAECHAEPPTCGCGDAPPVGIVTKVVPWSFRENVAHTVQMVRHAHKENHPSLETLFLGDLRALLATRSAR
jgi:hypothetical protein